MKVFVIMLVVSAMLWTISSELVSGLRRRISGYRLKRDKSNAPARKKKGDAYKKPRKASPMDSNAT